MLSIIMVAKCFPRWSEKLLSKSDQRRCRNNTYACRLALFYESVENSSLWITARH